MDWALAVVAFALIAFGVVSRRVEGTPITSAMIFVCVGLLVGTKALDLLDTPPTGRAVRLLAEATLTVVLFADASRIDLRTLRREYAVPARLLGIGLPLTIALGRCSPRCSSALFVPEALVLAVLLAPTDAALGQAVVTEPRLPSRIRQGLNVESGLNDGICVPLLFIVLAVAEADAGEVGAAHAVRLVVEEIGFGMLGGVARRRRRGGRGRVRKPSRSDRAVLAADHPGRGRRARLWNRRAARRLRVHRGIRRGHDLRGPPAAGAGRRASRSSSTRSASCSNGVTLLVFGAVLLWPTLDGLTWRIALYAVASLTVVRMLPVAIAMLGTGARPPTVAFLGWFGPRGLASIVFAVIVVQEADLPHANTILLTTYATVGLSVLAHGLTAAPLARRYAAWFASHPRDDDPAMESVPAGSHPWRRATTTADVRPEPDG